MSRLKSNMDRFIESCSLMLNQLFYSLKSNMDRFIVKQKTFVSAVKAKFKIQYG